MEEITALLCWGFRARSRRGSALAKMQEGEALDPRVTLAEDTAGGVAPSCGRASRPSSVPLIAAGKLVSSLVTAHGARIQTVKTAPTAPRCRSLAMGGGTPADARARALDTGLAVGTFTSTSGSPRVPHHRHDAPRSGRER
jgi:hypothetical protein